jgi:hypothetical protein
MEAKVLAGPSRGYPWSDERALLPLTLSLSLWERGRPNSGHGLLPLPGGEGWGEG